MSGHDSPVTPGAMSPPRRLSLLDRSPSPHVHRVSTPSRLPSITHHQPFELDDSRAVPIPGPIGHAATTVIGFSPSNGTHPPAPVTGSPVAAAHLLGKRPTLSPQIASPVEGHFSFFPGGPGSPRMIASSPRGLTDELPSRSRRNSAAIVSISLSSRSRSRTPRGSTSVLPARSGSGTPSKATTPKGEPASSMLGLADAWAPGVEEMDDWQPTGGVLLDADESMDETGDSYDDFDSKGRSWTAESEASRVADVLRPGMVFGEGLEFEGDVIEPAVGRHHGHDSDVGLPLRRDGSHPGKSRSAHVKKAYQVIRQLGSGSYAVVYLVREQGGRKREYALKCLSKHDLEEEQLETQLFEATIHLSLPIHTNIVTLHETLQTKNWLFLMLELCPGEDLFYWLERSRDASPPVTKTRLPGTVATNERGMDIMSSSRLSSSAIPFSTSQMFSNFPSSYSNSPNAFSPNGFSNSSYSASPASLLFAHHNGSATASLTAATPPTPSLLSAFSANTLLTQRRLRLIASMFSQMCEAVAICHEAGVSHRDIKPENFICCDSVELESVADGDDTAKPDFGPQAKQKVIVKLTDFGLATTEDESGDVECGSKPYMSYECRNNLGPTYRPAPADVWSLGIVLINMLFHRNPWKDPTDGDPNFDTFMMDPVAFFQSKFTGIGKEVATYLAEHVLCIEVEDRASARELARWIRQLPEMIGGRRAVHALKMARLETRNKSSAGPKDLFVKSPVGPANPTQKSAFTSALTSTAPVPVPNSATSALFRDPDPALSSLPILPEHAPSLGSVSETMAMVPEQSIPQAAPTPDLDRDEIRSATTVDDYPTPTDRSAFASPEPTESGDVDDQCDLEDDARRSEVDERSLSTHKRRKRGVRKGKAAKMAEAAAAGDNPSQQERDAFAAELVAASEELARDLSKKKPFDAIRAQDFPPLGTTPAQAAAERKSKWKDFMAMSKGNPQLEALARRVAERESAAGGTWSAPAKLQQGVNPLSRPHPHKHHATTSSGLSSQLSSIATASSSATSSSASGPDSDDWRRLPRHREDDERQIEASSRPSSRQARRRDTEDSSRTRQAALAAAALAESMGPMGAFGKPSHLGRPSQASNGPHRPARSPLAQLDKRIVARDESDRWAPPTSSVAMSIPPTNESKPQSTVTKQTGQALYPPSSNASAETATLATSGSATSLKTITGASTVAPTVAAADSPNKPKLKGQISSLAKMLGGLKTKDRH